MADEITYTIAASARKSALNYQFNATTFTPNMSGSVVRDFVQTIGFAAAENVDVGDIGTGYYVIAINLDATNFVNLGHDATGFVPWIKIGVGEVAGPFRLSTARTLQAQADTGAVNVRFIQYAA